MDGSDVDAGTTRDRGIPEPRAAIGPIAGTERTALAGVHDPGMDQDRLQARLALSLIEGMLRGDAVANSLAVETFDDVEQAAQAHAHLSGFLLEVLAAERQQSAEATARYVRSLLEQ